MKSVFIVTCLAATLASSLAFAAEETIAALSKSCDQAKIKELGGDAVLSVKPNESGATGVYDITFDNNKTSAQILMKKLLDAKCPM